MLLVRTFDDLISAKRQGTQKPFIILFDYKKWTPRCSNSSSTQHCSSSKRKPQQSSHCCNPHRRGRVLVSLFIFLNYRETKLSFLLYFKKIFEPSAIRGRIPPFPLIAKVVYKKGTPRRSNSSPTQHRTSSKRKPQQASHCSKPHRRGRNQFVRY